MIFLDPENHAYVRHQNHIYMTIIGSEVMTRLRLYVAPILDAIFFYCFMYFRN